MSGPFDHIRPGQMIPSRTDTWNGMLDAARHHHSTRGGRTGSGTVGIGVNPSLTVLVQNKTGGNLDGGWPVRLDREVTAIGLEFSRKPVYEALAPTGNATDVIAVLAEPIEDEGLGRAWIAGHAVAVVDVSDVGHPYAVAAVSDTTTLHSAPEGAIPILGERNATGSQLLGVLLGGGGGKAPLPVHVEITGEADEYGYCPCDPQVWSTFLEEWVSILGTGEAAYAFGPNEEVLTEGVRYIAHYYGTDGDGRIYVTERVEDRPAHVTPTASVGEGGYYPCTVERWEGSEWVPVEGDAFCFEPNEETLVQGVRYIAHYYDTDEDGDLYVTQARESLGCGLEMQEADGEANGLIRVAPADFVTEGNGLKITEGVSSEDCATISLEVGCGLKEGDDGELAIDFESTALECIRGVNGTDGDCGYSLAFGCGLTLGDDPTDPLAEALVVDLESLAGDSEKTGLEIYDPAQLDPEDPDYDPEPGCRSLKVADFVTQSGVHVLITGEAGDGGYYPCSVQEWDGFAWETTGTAFAFEPNELPLVNGHRYLASYHASDDDGDLYATQAREAFGCGLMHVADGEDAGKLALDLEAIIGTGESGLEVVAGEEGECDTLAVAVACPLALAAEGVTIDLEKLVGESNAQGLEVVSDETCDYIGVKAGCGITVGEDGVSVDLASIAGEGLEVYDASGLDPEDPDYDAEACPQLRVTPVEPPDGSECGSVCVEVVTDFAIVCTEVEGVKGISLTKTTKWMKGCFTVHDEEPDGCEPETCLRVLVDIELVCDEEGPHLTNTWKWLRGAFTVSDDAPEGCAS